jgi:hypothetical protein
MDKAVVEEIKKRRWKEREDKLFKKGVDTSIDWIVQKIVEKCDKTWFVITWISIVVRDKGDKFHYDFQVGLWVDLCRYKGVNFDYTTCFNKRLDS